MRTTDPKPTRSASFIRFYSERWIALKLGMPLGWDGGVTTAEQRREIIRREILERGIAAEYVSRGHPGREKRVSWAALFERAYGQPLQTDECAFAQTATDVR